MKHAQGILLGTMIFLTAAAMSSCGNSCYECQKGYSVAYFCRDNYPSNKTFQADMKQAKAWGYKCRKQ